jgi:hypothetical protein
LRLQREAKMQDLERLMLAMPNGCLSAISARKKSPADAMHEEARADHAVAFEDSEAANS